MVLIIGVFFIAAIFYSSRIITSDEYQIRNRFIEESRLNNTIKYEYYTTMMDYYKIPD
jgi:hypothetical protein